MFGPDWDQGLGSDLIAESENLRGGIARRPWKAAMRLR